MNFGSDFMTVHYGTDTSFTDTTLGKILTDEDSTQFWITFSLSLLSASIGLAKCLKNGVAGTFQSGGILDGLCSVQFILAFLGKGSKIKLLKYYFFPSLSLRILPFFKRNSTFFIF